MGSTIRMSRPLIINFLTSFQVSLLNNAVTDLAFWILSTWNLLFGFEVYPFKICNQKIICLLSFWVWTHILLWISLTSIFFEVLCLLSKVLKFMSCWSAHSVLFRCCVLSKYFWSNESIFKYCGGTFEQKKNSKR